MDLLGDWWTPLVLREAFYGVRRFDDFQRELGIARNTLTDRLHRLVGEGLLEKQPYQREPTRYDYVLTEKGRDFFGVLAAMSRWGDRWLAGGKGRRSCSTMSPAATTPTRRSSARAAATRCAPRTRRCGWDRDTRTASSRGRTSSAGSPLAPRP